MSTNGQLYPRYKVIAPFFHMNCKVGDIIDFSDGYSTKQLTRTPYDDQWGETLYATHGFDEAEIKDYPHLFKKLEWWEDLTPEQVPKYIKSKDRKEVREVIELIPEGFKAKYPERPKGYRICYNARWLPATMAEYEAHINQKEKQ